MHFFFFEIDEANYKHLLSEVDELGELRNSIHIHPLHADYQAHIQNVLQKLRDRGQQLAPSFAFVDPYGFSLSMDFLNEILSFPATELLINFMYRYIDMAITHEDQAANMDDLFGGGDWRALRVIEDADDRSRAAIALFGQQLKAKYVTHMYMRATNGALKYALIHATNHRRGRELMKEAMWKIAPDGTFSASERDSPNQPVLLVPEPALGPLRKQLWDSYAGTSVSMHELYSWLLNQTYLPKHLHQVLREYRNAGVIDATDYEGRFAFNKNPTITFPTSPDRN